jgi:tetratricopeptide (TPR) repeat protein
VALLVVARTLGSVEWPGWVRGLGARVGMELGTPPEVERGLDAYARGDLQTALNELTRARREYPHLVVPALYLGRTYRELGDWRGAGEILGAAVKQNPEDGLAHREFGAFLLARGQHHAREGRQERARADYELALKFFDNAGQLNFEDRIARGYLACTHAMLGNRSEAEQHRSAAGPGPWGRCFETRRTAPKKRRT